MGFASTALAEPTFYDPDFPLVGYECIDCHVHPLGGGSCNLAPSTVHPLHPCLNPFGRAFRDNTGGYDAALGAEDHDADGLSNLTELTTGTGSAGFPAGAESVGCDMLAAATSPNTWVTCGTSNVQVRATWGTSPLNNYSFAFRCMNGSSPALSNADRDWTDRCLDVDECAGNPCAPGTCTELPLGDTWASPGYSCGCSPGYASTGMGCILVDACMAGEDNCAGTANCLDTPGSSAAFTCACPGGYAGDGTAAGSGCTPVDECASHPCAPAGTGGDDGMGCTEIALGSWTAPGYTCTCSMGYEPDGTTCVLTDECTAGLDDCDPAAICIDASASRMGDYSCTCPSGYLGGGHGVGGCRDINECAMSIDDCAAVATCTNTGGGFTCECPTGYAGDGRTCTEIDECLDPVLGNCGAHAVCINMPGTFECRCDPGYRNDGMGCLDADECALGTDDCAPVGGLCTNTDGSFTCACDGGFEGDGYTCTDIDECLDPTITSRCSTAASCVNLPGNWECRCDTGYIGDGYTCEDVDECMDGTHTCDANAACGNTIGSYTCTCNEFFRGSGFECTDIDECAEATDDCTSNERCVNQVGMAPTCVCLPGYVRNMAGECVTACGDGDVGPGESCDDGNSDDGDGCDHLCTVEMGWACYEPTGAESVCTMTCGDGFVDPSEECDDADANARRTPAVRLHAACLRRPIVDTGEGVMRATATTTRASTAAASSCASAYCGDGVVADTGEMCDPGGLSPDMARPVACTHECGSGGEDGGVGAGAARPGWTAAATATRRRARPACGPCPRRPGLVLRKRR
ncbi:MAG: EGF domain-containing protein [Sandaracinaceae bacterium]